MSEKEENQTARIKINGEIIEVPVEKQEDGSAVPVLEVEVNEGKVQPRYVPGNFPWKTP